MDKSEIELFKHESKSEWYLKHNRNKWQNLYESQHVILDKTQMDNMSILEIGCAAGGLYEILKNKYKNIKYTGFDISEKEIQVARKKYREANFVCGNFLENSIESNSFDAVIGFLVVSHQRDYKKFISELIRLAKHKVIFDVRLRYEGATNTDLDFSFVYYHESGKRNHMVVFNFYELFNYFHIERFNIKKISIYGYYPKDKTSGFVPMPKSKMIAAAICLEKHPPGKDILRKGTRTEYIDKDWIEYDITLPDFSMDNI